MTQTLIVLDKEELTKLELISSGKITVNGTEESSEILSGVFRGVAGQFHYLPTTNSIVIPNNQREKFGLKPKK